MDAQASGAQAPGGDAPHPSAEGRQAPLGLLDAARTLWDDTRGALIERARLALLEVRLAGVTLLHVVVYAVVVAVLAVTAWLALVGGIVAALVSAGLHWGWGLAIVVVVNLALAAWLVFAMLRMVERVGLPSSLRRVASEPADPGG